MIAGVAGCPALSKFDRPLRFSCRGVAGIDRCMCIVVSEVRSSNGCDTRRSDRYATAGNTSLSWWLARYGHFQAAGPWVPNLTVIGTCAFQIANHAGCSGHDLVARLTSQL